MEDAAEKDGRGCNELYMKDVPEGFAGGDAQTKGASCETKDVADTRAGGYAQTKSVPETRAGGDAQTKGIPAARAGGDAQTKGVSG